MSDVTVKAAWSEDMHTCSITIGRGVDSHTYHNLRVKKTNLRDREDPQVVYTIKIPCEAALGCNYMACFGQDAVYGYKHPEYTELVFTPLNDEDEIMDLPQRKKSKKRAEYQQMLLFAAAEAAARGEA